MIQTLAKPLTLDEFLAMPETKPASEYIDGQVIQKPMPQGKHSRLQGKLVGSINTVVEPQRIALALPELRCTFGGRSIVPDVAVLIWNRIPVDQQGEIANAFPLYPDWTIEILSPEQRQTKVTGNILHCLQYGCSLGWLLDPEEQSLLVFPPKQQPILIDDLAALLPTPDWAIALQLTLGDMFGWLKI
jgi:Uma2 family endonuclease